MRFWLTLGLICCAAISPAFAQTSADPKTLEEVQKAAEAARAEETKLSQKREKVSAEITTLKKDLQKNTRQIQVFEREAEDLQDALGVLQQDVAQITARLQTDKTAISQLIAALQRLDVNPPPTLTTNPKNAIEAAQGAELMGQLSKQLKARSGQLALTLEELAAKQAEMTQRQSALAANQKDLKNRTQRTRRLVAQKDKLKQSIGQKEAKAREDVKRLAAQSKTLQDLINTLEEQSADINPRIKPRGKPNKRPSKPLALPKGVKSFASAKGKLMRPITGKLLRGYGKAEKGLTYTGQNNGQVRAPYAGRVEFSGPFKNYDQVIIFNVGDGYFILLTGLGEIFSKTGDIVNIGDPVGLLPFKTKDHPTIYFELRKGGTTINPAPWLRPRTMKNG